MQQHTLSLQQIPFVRVLLTGNAACCSRETLAERCQKGQTARRLDSCASYTCVARLGWRHLIRLTTLGLAGNMGMFACFATPAPTIQKQEHLQKVTNELTAAKSLVTQLQQELQQVHTDHTQLLQQVSKAPTKQDAATSMPLAVVEGQAKPPVILESKNPQPTGRQQHSITSRIASPEVAIKSRIPTHPAGISAENGSSSRAPKEVVSESPKADSAGFIRAGRSGQDTQWACHNDSSSLAEVAELEQRIVMLQQQHKVAEAFRASLEAQLRDARFANSSLQTQVLSLQTKFEKTVEEQVSELERLEMLCKDGQLRYDAVASELAQLKQDSSAAEELVACRSQLDAALSQVADREVQLVQVTSELHKTQQQLADVREQLATTQNLVEHMAGNAKTLAQQHQQQVEKVSMTREQLMYVR